MGGRAGALWGGGESEERRGWLDTFIAEGGGRECGLKGILWRKISG